jgi:hypothetical protein
MENDTNQSPNHLLLISIQLSFESTIGFVRLTAVTITYFSFENDR